MKKGSILIEALLGFLMSLIVLELSYQLIKNNPQDENLDLYEKISESCPLECLIEKHLH